MLNYISYFNARRLEKNKQWKPALEAYKKIVKDQKVIPAKISYRIGFVAEKIQDWKTAETWLGKAVKQQADKAQWIYRLALAQEKNKKYALAINNYKKALKIIPDKAEWIFRCGLCNELLDRYSEAIGFYNTTLALAPEMAECHYRLGKVLCLSGENYLAEDALRKSISMDPMRADYMHELSVAFRKQGRINQEVEILEHSLELEPSNAQWNYELGLALEKIDRIECAASAYHRANEIKKGNPLWYYKEGHCWERVGRIAKAEQAYQLACDHDNELSANALGIGVFHEQNKYWIQAVNAYEVKTKNQLFNRNLFYRLAVAQDRCHLWEKSVLNYKQALLCNPSKSADHFRLGYAYERSGRLTEAVAAYEYAIAHIVKPPAHWFYRLGVSLSRLFKFKEACEAFIKFKSNGLVIKQISADADEHNISLPEHLHEINAHLKMLLSSGAAFRSTEQSSAFYQIGMKAVELEMWEEAIEAFSLAATRNMSHDENIYYFLAYSLYRSHDYAKACVAFSSMKIFGDIADQQWIKYIEANPTRRKNVVYTEFWEKLPIQENIILYESYGGIWMSCSPLSIFRQLFEHEDFLFHTHVWVVGDIDRVPEEWRGHHNIIYVERDSDLYLRYLCSAKWLIHNSSFPTYFLRKEGQKYLNTWHGTPLKYLGKDILGNFMEHRYSTRNRLQATHLINPNEFTRNVLIDRCDIKNIISAEVLESGYPRNDRVKIPCQITTQKIKKALGINDGKPVVLYAPTWRGLLGHAEVDPLKLQNDLESMSNGRWHTLFRGHYFSEKAIGNGGLSAKIVPADIDTSDLLGITDLLITDYSSIFVDFINRLKPIIYYAYDFEEYSAKRGMYFDLNAMPGNICMDSGRLSSSIEDALFSEYLPCDKHFSALDRFCHLDDGNATNRVIDFFFKSKYSPQTDQSEKSRKLVYAGNFDDDDVFNALLDWLNKQNLDSSDLYLAIDPDQIKSMERFQIASANFNVIARAGRRLATAEEEWLRVNLEDRSLNASLQINDILRIQYRREFKRIFGQKKFDEIINLSPCNEFWEKLFSYQSQS